MLSVTHFLLCRLFCSVSYLKILAKARQLASDGNSWKGAQPLCARAAVSCGWRLSRGWIPWVCCRTGEGTVGSVLSSLSLLHRKSNVWRILILHFHSLSPTTNPWSAVHGSVRTTNAAPYFGLFLLKSHWLSSRQSWALHHTKRSSKMTVNWQAT